MNFEAGKTYVFDDPPYDVLSLYSPFEDILVFDGKTRKPIMLIERASGGARWWALTDKGRFIVFESDMEALKMWQVEHLDQMMNNES